MTHEHLALLGTMQALLAAAVRSAPTRTIEVGYRETHDPLRKPFWDVLLGRPRKYAPVVEILILLPLGEPLTSSETEQVFHGLNEARAAGVPIRIIEFFTR